MCTLPASSQYPRGSGHPFFLDPYMASGAEHQGLDKEPLNCLIVPRVRYWVAGEGVPMMRALENQRSGGQAGVGGPGLEFRGCVSGSCPLALEEEMLLAALDPRSQAALRSLPKKEITRTGCGKECS